MVDPIKAWHSDHANFLKILELLERELNAFHQAEQPNYDLMRDIVFYLCNYSDRFHHPREDVAFAKLASRDPTMRLPIGRLLQEHRVIAEAGKTLLQYLEEILEDAIIERATVEAAAATYLLYYRHHINEEESEIMPRARQLLTDDDWRAVATAVSSSVDPVFGASQDIDVRYRELRRQILQ
jgi:hemerythrin-like domain-containing protein